MRKARRAFMPVLISVSVLIAISSCSAPSPSDTSSSPAAVSSAKAVELYPETTAPSPVPAEEDVETTKAPEVDSVATADEVKLAVEGFFEAIRSDTKTAVIAGGGEIDPKLATFDEQFKSSYSFIDRNKLSTKQSASLVYGIATNYVEQPDMKVTIDTTLIKVDGDSAFAAAADMLLNLPDGSMVKPSAEDTSVIGLSKASGKWLIVSDS